MKKIINAILWSSWVIKEILFKKGYRPIFPRATYAPWTIDEKFQETWKIVRGNSLVDIYRGYELWLLMEQAAKTKGAMLEVGVWRGASSGIIGKSAQLNGIQDTLYLCDTFEGVVKAGPKDSTYVGNEHSNTTIDKVNEVIKKLELKNVKVLKGIFPDETSNQVTDKSFKFCHIDVDVYKSAEDIFNWIWPKMEIGGIVVFDDYGFSMCDGITKFVNENRSRDDLCYVHNLNGHAIFIKSRESNRKQ